MGDYQRVVLKKFPRPPSKRSSEVNFWKRFDSPIIIKEYASVTSISFAPITPYDFAVTSSTRVQIYSSKTHQPKKTISRFNDTAYSACFREDGKLIVAGDATGLVQLFDISSRAILRKFSEHKMPVHITRFTNDKTGIISASDDQSVRVWDIPTGSCANVFEEHEDYVRAGVVSNDNPNILMTGGYDQTVKMWDRRQTGSVMTMRHGAPVEALLLYPGSGAIVSAGGPTFKIWDIMAGGRCIHALSNHQKTITSLCFDGAATRLITGSLDQHVKIYDVQDYQVIHSIKYPAPILSVGMSPDDTHLAAGMANGLLSIRQRKVKAAEKAANRTKKDFIRAGTYKYFMRGQANKPTEDDMVVDKEQHRKLNAYDKYLRKFQHADALDAALKMSPENTASLLQELIRRKKLDAALQGRDENTLEPLLRFILKYIHNPNYTDLLVDVTDVVFDLYMPVFGHSPVVDDLLSRLEKKVKAEIEMQKEISQTKAILDMLFARSTGVSNATTASSTTTPLTATFAPSVSASS